MKKHLFESKVDFDKWLEELVNDTGNDFAGFSSIEEIENFFEIDFLNDEGKAFVSFEDEWLAEEGEEECEWQMASPIRYNVRHNSYDEPQLPDHYPCIAIAWFESTFDRIGDMEIRLLNFIYLDDFIKNETTTNPT